MVPEGGVLDGVLRGQGNAAEQNEEEDQVGEDRVIDNAMTLEAKPEWKGGKERDVSGKMWTQLLGSQELRPSIPSTSLQKVLTGSGSALKPEVLLLLGNDQPHDVHLYTI